MIGLTRALLSEMSAGLGQCQPADVPTAKFSMRVLNTDQTENCLCLSKRLISRVEADGKHPDTTTIRLRSQPPPNSAVEH